MRVAGLLLGFGTILVLGLVVSQIGLGFHPRLRSISTMPEPSKKDQLESIQLEQLKRITLLEERLSILIQSEKAPASSLVPPTHLGLENLSSSSQKKFPLIWRTNEPAHHAPITANPVASVSTQPKPVLQQAPVAPKASREERAAYNKEVAGLKEAAELAVLQAEVDADVAAFKARGVDWSKRLSQLHVPQDPPSPVSSADAFGAPKYWGGLRDLLLDKPSKLGICPIEKVASSELKKLMLRMMGDPKWRDEPWFKGGIHKIKFEKDLRAVEEIMNRPEWTKAVFLRHPFERLVSCYKDKFRRKNRYYSVKMTGNMSTHILSFAEFVHLITAPESNFQNVHWRPQSRFCGLAKYKSKYNFIGNFEKLSSHMEILLKGTDLWDSFGSHGWPWRDKKTGTIYYNGSMFGGNAAAHCTSCDTLTINLSSSKSGGGGLLKFDPSSTAKTYDELLPPGSELRRLAFEYYKDDFELFASIDTPPWDNTRYKADLVNKGG